MSRIDLYDLALEHGGLDLIPEDLCREDRIGRDRVFVVFVHRLMYADPVGVMAWGQRTIAAALHIDYRTVRRADAVLERAGLMERTGTRSRATKYRMIPRILDAITAGHDQDDEDAHATAHATAHGNAHGNAHGTAHGSVRRREVKGSEGGTRARATPRNLPPEYVDLDSNSGTPRCPRHGTVNSPEPCFGCKRAEEQRQELALQQQREKSAAEREAAIERARQRRRRDPETISGEDLRSIIGG